MDSQKDPKGKKATKTPTKTMSDSSVSLCIPSTIIAESNTRNLEQITNTAYQIAKAATIYNVSEIVILDVPSKSERERREEQVSLQAVQLPGELGNKKIKFGGEADIKATTSTEPVVNEQQSKDADNALLFATLLQYFVTPDYLVKSVFKTNKFAKKLLHAEKLPKLSTLPFMNNNSVGRDFKEGLTVAKHTPKVQKKKSKVSAMKKLKVTKYVNVGEAAPLVLTGSEVPVGVRVTVDIKNKQVVSPQVAYGVTGCKSSFGYFVRLAKSFSAVFTELAYPEGYSESLFVQAEDYFGNATPLSLKQTDRASTGQVLLIVSKIGDIAYSFQADSIEGVDNVTDMFDGEIRVPAGLRIEDAAMIGLTRALEKPAC